MGTTLYRLRAPFGLAVTSLAVHLLPFIFHNAHPLGYDTGFYRRYLTQPFVSFPNPVVPGLGSDALLPRLVLDTLHFLNVPTDLALYGSYVLFFTLLPVIFYYWLTPFLGTRGAVIAGLLLALSPVGYTAFWYMLYKNAFILCLVLVAFIAYERRAFWPLILLDIAIAVSHKTTAIIYLATLGVLFFVDLKRWKEVALHSIVTTACLALVLFDSSVSPATLASGAVAVFIGWQDYLTFSMGLIIAAVVALINYKNLRVPKSLIALALASFAFPVLRLPFYERIFVFTDIALVAFAAYGVELLISRIQFDGVESPRSYTYVPYGYFAVVCLIVGLQLGNLQSQFSQLQPLETPTNLEQMSLIGNMVPDEAILLTTNNEAPWYEGWTEAHIAAPGMLRDFHNLEAWTDFWNSTSTPDRIDFLNSFPKPLYISTLGDFSFLIGHNNLKCLTVVAPKLLRNDCE